MSKLSLGLDDSKAYLEFDKMPEKCADCILCRDHEGCRHCIVNCNDIINYEYSEKKPCWCPLKSGGALNV